MICYTFLNENKYNLSRKKWQIQHEKAHDLLSAVLKKNFGIEKYSLGYGDHGKPYLKDHPNIFFNLSHCSGLVVCGVSDAAIGVDCELIRPYSGSAAKKIFSDSEIKFVSESEDSNKNFFRIWTLKEALGKNFGTGIFSDLKKYEFIFKYGNPVCGAADIFGKKFFSQQIICGKWVVSVCSDSSENIFEEFSEIF